MTAIFFDACLVFFGTLLGALIGGLAVGFEFLTAVLVALALTALAVGVRLWRHMRDRKDRP